MGYKLDYITKHVARPKLVSFVVRNLRGKLCKYPKMKENSGFIELKHTQHTQYVCVCRIHQARRGFSLSNLKTSRNKQDQAKSEEINPCKHTKRIFQA